MDHVEIREAVKKLCAAFPGEYWRRMDQARAYPTEFVTALTEAGYLAALIPEEYGGAGLPLSAAAAILETVQAEGCNGAACHAQMYIMGTILRHGTPAQKETYLPKIATGELRLQAFGVTEPTRFSAGTIMLSKNTSVELWFIMVRMGRMVSPLPRAARMSTMKVESPSVRFWVSSFGVVRASRSMRSECSAREVQTFWPFTT